MTEDCPAAPCDLKVTTDTRHRVSRQPHHGYHSTYGMLPIIPKNLEVDQLSEPSFSRPQTRPDILNNTYPFTEQRRSNVFLKHSIIQGTYPTGTDDGNNDGLRPTLDVSHRILGHRLKAQCAGKSTALTERYNTNNTHLINSKYYQNCDSASDTGSVHSDLKLTTDCRHRRSTSGGRSTNVVSSSDYNFIREHSGNLENRQGIAIERVNSDNPSARSSEETRHVHLAHCARSTSLVWSPDYNCVYNESGNLVKRQGVGIDRVHNGEHNLDTKSVTSDLRLSVDCSHRRRSSVESFTDEPHPHGIKPDSNQVHRPTLSMESVYSRDKYLDKESVVSDLQLTLDCSHRHLHRSPHESYSSVNQMGQSTCITHSSDSGLHLTLDCSHRRNNRSRLSDSFELPVKTNEDISSCRVNNNDEERNFIVANQINSIVGRSIEGRSSANQGQDTEGSGCTLTPDCSYKRQTHSSIVADQSLGSHSDSGLELTLDCSHRTHSVTSVSDNSFSAAPVDTDSSTPEESSRRKQRKTKDGLTSYVKGIKNCTARRQSSRSETENSSHRETSSRSGTQNSSYKETSSRSATQNSSHRETLSRSATRNSSHRETSSRSSTQNSSHTETSSRSVTQNSSHIETSSKRTESNNKDSISKSSDQAELCANESDEKNAVFGAESDSVKQGETKSTNTAVFVDLVSPCFSDNKDGGSKSDDQAKPRAIEVCENNDNLGHALKETSRKRRKRFRSGSDSNLLISNKKIALKRHQSTQRLNGCVNTCYFDSSCQPGDNVLKPASKDNIISETEETITGSSETSTKLTKDIKDVNGKSEKASEEHHAHRRKSEKANKEHHAHRRESEKAIKEHHALRRESGKNKKESHARKDGEKRALKSQKQRKLWPGGDRKLEFIHNVHQAIAKVDQNTGDLVPGVNTANHADVDLSSLETIMPLNKENGENDRKAKHNFLRKNGVLYRRHESNGIWESVVSKYVS